jgi:hypothetical protein
MLEPTLSTFIYKTFKGFFRKKLTGEYFLCFLAMEDGYLLFQFMNQVEEDKYIVHVIGAGSTRDEKYINELIDFMNNDNKLETVELKVPVKITGEHGIIIKFTKNSKVFKSNIELYSDSRLPQRYYLADVKMKEEQKPAIIYKIGEDFGATKAMSAVTKVYFIKNLFKADKVELAPTIKKLK